MTLIGNLSRAGGTSVTDHAVEFGRLVSGAVAKQTEAEDIRVGVSIDQVLAGTWVRRRRFRRSNSRQRIFGLRRRMRTGL